MGMGDHEGKIMMMKAVRIDLAFLVVPLPCVSCDGKGIRFSSSQELFIACLLTLPGER
jgi:hypothetical protein